LVTIVGQCHGNSGYSYGHGHKPEVHHVKLVCKEDEKKSPLIVKSRKHTIILGHGDNKNVIVDKNGDKLVFRRK